MARYLDPRADLTFKKVFGEHPNLVASLLNSLYKVVHEKYTDRLIEGFHIVFVELPKFKPQSIAERRMAVLWLRFLTEINKTTEQVPDEFMESSEISQAVKFVEESAYTREQWKPSRSTPASQSTK